MSDDRAFINSLLATPDDAAPWLVYADWLDERGDARGEYIRLVQSLATKPDDLTRRRLNAVRPALPREWLAVVEQPKLLRANPTPYKADWFGVDWTDDQSTDATYATTDYRTLPVIPTDWLLYFDDWFDERATHRAASLEAEAGGWDPDFTALSDVSRNIYNARAVGTPLPNSFGRFFRDDRHAYLIESATDCYFNLPSVVSFAPGAPGCRLVRFYSDSRGHPNWYMYLTPEGDSCVVASQAYLGGRIGDNRGDPEGDPEFWFCAPSFEEFIVRTWIENVAWWHVRTPESAGQDESRWAASPEGRAYLGHYRT
jgi:uncharacterized protein (TIGR02996 family)